MYGFSDDLTKQVKCEKVTVDERDKLFVKMIKHIAVKCTPPSD
jgi:hypothetical protein